MFDGSLTPSGSVVRQAASAMLSVGDRLLRLYVLFFIELGRRRVHFAGCTPNPSSLWVTQQARQLAWTFPERADPVRFLIRDRDDKFTRNFDAVFRSEGIRIVRTPGAPQANAYANHQGIVPGPDDSRR
jgi:hypothetical protein